jgi:hypothetical protein
MPNMGTELLECMKYISTQGIIQPEWQHSNQGCTPHCPHTYSVDHDRTLKKNDGVPGCPKGEHICMHRGQLVKEKAIVNELFIIETISDFELISGGRISFGKSARDGNIYLLAAKQLSHSYCE